MTLALGLAAPMLASLLLAVGSGWLIRVLPPATGVRLLVLSSLVTAAATGFVLAVVAFSAVALDAEVAAVGHWSVRVLRAISPIPWWAGPLAGTLVVPLFVAALARAGRAGKELWAADIACRHLGPGVGGLVVIDDDQPDAFVLQGLRGRTVVSTGMLAALSVRERRVLLAHESSHLRNRHPLFVLLADLAAAANPLLRPTAAAVRLGVERWADEDAAAVVGDRPLAARALARAALASHAAPASPPRWNVALAMAAENIRMRARALLAPPLRQRHALAGMVLAVTLVVTASTAVVARITEGHFEQAQYHVTTSSP